jgi:5-methyltetrahydropteroyltriglutamate--homocysteine methyltransferase
MSVKAINLGFPRIGLARELKRALERHWKDACSTEDLLETARQLRLHHWRLQRAAGIDLIPCNDFSLYDHVLDTACLLGCVPSRYRLQGEMVDPATYFSMARGSDDAAAMEMTKWYDTNYHYLVPEFEAGAQYRVASDKPFAELAEAQAAGIEAVPVLIGPVTFVTLGKPGHSRFSFTGTVEKLLPVYAEILRRLARSTRRVHIEEPCLVTDLHAEAKESLVQAYRYLDAAVDGIALHLVTYFGALKDNLDLAFSLPVDGMHVDLCRAPEQTDACIERARERGTCLSLGLIDGRNVWRNDLRSSVAVLERALHALGPDRVAVGPSCSLLHTPIDLENETEMDEEIRDWLAFGAQKLNEITILKRYADEGPGTVEDALRASDAARERRRASKRIHDASVKQRVAAVTPELLHRASPGPARRELQRELVRLPLLPTTTIGSFPQTEAIRAARAAYKSGHMDTDTYEAEMRREIAAVVRFQERVGLDVLVHGEPERNDMVEYFGERLRGFVFTRNGWVQSYGSRCVKPPIIFGDIARPEPMTVSWSRYAQSLTDRCVKGMLTGPVTMLQWSFVRDDQPRAQTCQQAALAIRDEVMDLESAGIRMIQIDEPAIREGLPLRHSEWQQYLRWAVDAFRLASAGVADTTQIHTHMCYAQFNDIIDSIAELDADVVSIEATRSQMELLGAFAKHEYSNDVGPGIYDVHSPRVPTALEVIALLRQACKVLRPEQIWVNPDCGLKTRAWDEIEPALTQMVAAASEMRRELRAAAHDSRAT